MSAPPNSLQETLKLGHNFVRDDIVYLPKLSDGNLELSHVFAKKYLHGDVWLEMHWTSVLGHAQNVPPRSAHYHVTVRIRSQKAIRNGKIDADLVAICGDNPVLIESPEFVQLPKGVTLVGVPSTVWLNRIEGVCDCGWKQESPLFVGGIIFVENQEANLSFFPLCDVSPSESPRELVKRGPQATDKITNQKRNLLWNRECIDCPEVPSFKIAPFLDRMRWSFDPGSNLTLKSFEVHVRPAGFHLHVKQPVEHKHLMASGSEV